ncbi:MAG: ASCH domain-containing protein [Bacilli bacterium]
MLTLPIKKKWFDMIKASEKLEEYREIKPYWTKRFENNLNEVTLNMNYRYPIIESAKGTVIFKNGYQKNAPKIRCKINLKINIGKIEWGAEPNKEYYVLKILSVEEVK